MLVLLFSLAACSTAEEEPASPSETPVPEETPEESPEAAQPAYQAGTYTVTATGHNCDFTVDVTFDDSSITNIVIGENSETATLANTPWKWCAAIFSSTRP